MLHRLSSSIDPTGLRIAAKALAIGTRDTFLARTGQAHFKNESTCICKRHSL